MSFNRYNLHVHWQARPEGTRSCAIRLSQMLSDLAEAHAAFAHWNRKAMSRATANKPAWKMPPDIDELTQLFEKGRRYKDATGELWPEMGYTVSAWNGLDPPYGASLAFRPGHYGDWIPLPNRVELDLAPVASDNASLMNAPLLKRAPVGMATAWEPDYGNVVPTTYWARSFGDDPYPGLRSGWMTYLAPRYATRITLPPAVIVEPVAGGGMLLLATEQRFDMDNPAHLAPPLTRFRRR
jgi:hypothetical protein